VLPSCELGVLTHSTCQSTGLINQQELIKLIVSEWTLLLHKGFVVLVVVKTIFSPEHSPDTISGQEVPHEARRGQATQCD
jgi:hypothetical protein